MHAAVTRLDTWESAHRGELAGVFGMVADDIEVNDNDADAPAGDALPMQGPNSQAGVHRAGQFRFRVKPRGEALHAWPTGAPRT